MLERPVARDHLAELVHGSPKEHPSLRFADPVAGAGPAVARRCNGRNRSVDEDPYPLIAP
jgi:hypothetical protein